MAFLLQICYSTFCRLPHICCIQNQGLSKSLLQNTKNFMGILAFILQILNVLVYWTMSFLRKILLYCFATSSYLLPLNQGFQSHYFKQQKSRLFQHLSYRHLKIWFIGQCHFFAYMLRYTYTTYSYLLPLKPRFSMSLLQTRGTWRVFYHLSYRHSMFWFITRTLNVCKMNIGIPLRIFVFENKDIENLGLKNNMYEEVV